jgi:hypothetical protein
VRVKNEETVWFGEIIFDDSLSSISCPDFLFALSLEIVKLIDL